MVKRYQSVYRRGRDNTMVKRYQRGNQNQYIEEEQTTQWPKDTKEVIRICISMKNRQHNGQTIQKRQSESVYRRRTDNTMVKRYQRGNQNMYMEEEQTTQWSKDTNLYIEEEETTQWSKDTKEVIRICISKKNRQHNGQTIPKR